MATTKKAAAKPAAKKAAPKKRAAAKKAPAKPVIEDTPSNVIPADQAPDGKATDVDVAVLTADAGDAHAVLHLDGKKFRLGGEIVAALRRAFEQAHSIVNPGH